MTFASLASADTTDEKLDLILKKLEVIEETYSKFLKATETLNGIFPEGSFEDEKITPNDEGYLENAVAAALEEIDSKIDKEAIKIPNKEYLKVVNWTAKDLGTRLGAVGKVIEIEFIIQNISDKKIALIDGDFNIEDKLGTDILRVGIDNDLNLSPNETYKQKVAYDSGTQFIGDMKRLVDINPNLVNFIADLDQILFDDGTILNFD